MKSKITLLLCLLLVFANIGGFAQAENSKDDGHNSSSNGVVTDTSDNQEAELWNYIGFTPTLFLFGMYGLVYGYALNNNIVLIAMGGYTNFDLIPIKFLRDWMRNENYLYSSGEHMNTDNNWVIMPFFDVNIGIVF